MHFDPIYNIFIYTFNILVMDYIIISSNSTDGLEKEVRMFLDMGYIPQGGVCYNNQLGRYLQALIKHK
jgi:hypothetical protein